MVTGYYVIEFLKFYFISKVSINLIFKFDKISSF